jgi:hypothetical protein
MFGALTLLGHVSLRQGRLREAQSRFDQAHSEYASAPQLFAPYMRALTARGAGDLERFHGQYGTAVGDVGQ